MPWPHSLRQAGQLAAGLAAGLVLQLTGAHAADCDIDHTAAPEPLARQSEALARRYAVCRDDARFLAYYGAVLLARGEARRAADLLERALLIDPAHAGARLDYARALARLGETAAARELVAPLAARDDLPAPVRAFLDRYLPRLDAPDWQRQASLDLVLAYDSNLLRAPSTDRLLLTLPEGALSLPLAAPAGQRRGLAWQASLHGRATRAWQGEHALALEARLEARATPDYAPADDWRGELQLHWRRRQDGHERLASLAFAHSVWQGVTLEQTLRLDARQTLSRADGRTDGRADGRDAPCRPWAGAGLEERHLPVAPGLDYRLAHVQLAWLCGGARPWLLQLQYGYEAAAERPGGDGQRLGLAALGQTPFAGGWLEAAAGVVLRREEKGLSPWLAHGAPLSTRRLALRLAWRKPLGASLEALLGLEAERQTANLALYEIERAAVTAGLRWHW